MTADDAARHDPGIPRTERNGGFCELEPDCAKLLARVRLLEARNERWKAACKDYRTGFRMAMPWDRVKWNDVRSFWIRKPR